MHIMRMTINLPDSLLASVMLEAGELTKTAVIVHALEEYVRKKKRERLISLKGRKLFYEGFDPESLRDDEDAELYAR
jgi:hypothetical protein